MGKSWESTKENAEKMDAMHRALADAYYAVNKENIAKTKFLANMSHNIRTPLNEIIGMAVIADANREDPDKVHSCMTAVLSSSKHLLGVVNEILDMNKLESGTMNLKAEPFRMSELIEVFLALSRPLLIAKKHELIVDIHDIVQDYVCGDRERIQQCLMNFMSNAVRYTSEGGLIRFEASEKPTNQPNVVGYEFVFTDNGIGMEEEFVQELFEPFSRADDRRGSGHVGTGLGMTITRALIQMMNGDIQVESRPNEGSCFTVTIFLSTQEGNGETVLEEKIEKTSRTDVTTDRNFEGRRVLVVEDNDLNAEITAEILKMTHLAVDCAKNGRDAVEILTDTEDGYYDLVFMDIEMPILDGGEATRKIRRKRREYLKKVPIIAMSANVFDEDVQMAKEAGMNDYLTKPVDLEVLMSILDRWLGDGLPEGD